MVGYYEYDTSPRDFDNDLYIPRQTNTRGRTSGKPKLRVLPKTKAKRDYKLIIEVFLVFALFAVIGYRVSIINSSLKEKEKLKTELSEIKKQNEQLQVNIEQQMNLKTVEKEAKEKLGMQKLDNNQKVYVTLPKQDYTEGNSNESIEENTEDTSWWSKLLKDLFNIK